MIAHIETFIGFYAADWQRLFTLGVIMVSAITVLVGLLKPFVFNKIKWKPLRRTCLAFTNVALCFVSVAVLFAIKHYDYSVYWHSAVATSVFSILWYWVYENTCLRDLISKIGSITLKKLFNKEDLQVIEREISQVINDKATNLKPASTSAKAKHDKELNNL